MGFDGQEERNEFMILRDRPLLPRSSWGGPRQPGRPPAWLTDCSCDLGLLLGPWNRSSQILAGQALCSPLLTPLDE